MAYEMTIEEIEEILHISKLSGYSINNVIISGGEPTLWRYYKKGIKKLYDSNIVKNVVLYTNGHNIKKILEVIDFIDRVRISDYNTKYLSYDNDNFKYLVDNYKHKIQIENFNNFNIIPKTKVANSIPGQCNCPGILFHKYKVYMCSMIPELSMLFSDDNDDMYNTSYTMNYMNRIYKKHGVNSICEGCIANKNVRDATGSIKNDTGYWKS